MQSDATRPTFLFVALVSQGGIESDHNLASRLTVYACNMSRRYSFEREFFAIVPINKHKWSSRNALHKIVSSRFFRERVARATRDYRAAYYFSIRQTLVVTTQLRPINGFNVITKHCGE